MATKKAEHQDADDSVGHSRNGIEALVLKQSSIQSIHHTAAQQARGLGETLIDSAHQRIGTGVDEHVKDVEVLFEQLVGSRPAIPKELEVALQQPANVPKVAPLAETHHKAVASARHTYDEARVEGVGKISSAKAAWSLALDVYEAAARNADVVLKAMVDEAKEEMSESTADFPAPSAQQYLYFQMSSQVGDGLEKYQEAMSAAYKELAAAQGALIEGITEGWNAVADAEAARIKASQTAWEDFWKEAQSALKTPDGSR